MTAVAAHVSEVPAAAGVGGIRVDASGVLTPWEAATVARELMAAAARTGPWKTCRYCPAPVLWVKTEGGSGMPLDLGDHPEGNMAARTEGGAVVARYCKPGQPLRPGERRVMTHFTTCPKADEARKSRAAKPGRTGGQRARR